MNLLVEGERDRKKLDSVRAKLAAAEATIEDIAYAPFPIDESLDRIMRQVDEKLRLAETQLLYFTRPGDGPALPNFDAGFVALLDSRPVFEEKMRAWLTATTPNPGLARAARDDKLKALRTQIDELERDEEREICALEARGYVVDRRVVDPDLLLQVWDQLESPNSI